jgi:hypothetical protein
VREQALFYYEISNLGKHCVVSKHTEGEVKVTSFSPSENFPIDDELTVIHTMQRQCFKSAILGVFATGIGAYFSVVKRNVYASGGGFVLASVCALAYAYFNKRSRIASFNAANKILSAYENSFILKFNPKNYGL